MQSMAGVSQRTRWCPGLGGAYWHATSREEPVDKSDTGDAALDASSCAATRPNVGWIGLFGGTQGT